MIYRIYTSENNPTPNHSRQSCSAMDPARPQVGLRPAKAKLPPRGPAAGLAPTPQFQPVAQVAPGTHGPCEPCPRVDRFHLPVLPKPPMGPLE